jgi:hypothetical protein
MRPQCSAGAGATIFTSTVIQSLAGAMPESEAPTTTRMAAVALWHVAKAALVRDFAERVLKGEVPPNAPTPDTLSHWLASRLLNPDEMADFEADDRSD